MIIDSNVTVGAPRECWGGVKKSDCRRFLPSPHPLPLLLIFRNLSQFSSPSRVFGKGKATAATQAIFQPGLKFAV